MYVTVNGTRLFFDVEGSSLVPDGGTMRQKPTVVMVHGGPGADHSIFRPAYSQLSDIAQIIYYDHRGNGRSDPSTNDQWNLDQWADDLRGLCDALGIEKPIVCGTSFGGFVAQAYATRNPDHMSKLILISTAAKMDFPKVFEAFGILGGAKAQQVARDYWTAPTSELRAEYFQHCVPLYQTKHSGNSDWAHRMIKRDETALWFNGPNNEHGKMDHQAALARVTCPVLVMAGDRDPITPLAFNQNIVDCLPAGSVRFEQFSNCGHGVVGDQPEQAFRVIREFILS